MKRLGRGRVPKKICKLYSHYHILRIVFYSQCINSNKCNSHFLLIFLSSDLCSSLELAFLLEPSDVIAVRDRPLMLDCRVEGEEPITVTWLKNGRPLHIGAGTRNTVLSNGTLLIRSFQKKRDGDATDAGEYHCAAQNRYGMLVSRKARVQLACECDRACDLYNIFITKLL